MCNKKSKQFSWSRESPSGYLYNKTWTPNGCELRRDINITKCLTNTHIKVVGDSTTRQMYARLKELFPCSGNTKILNVMHLPLMCKNSTTNFQLSYDLPALPYVTAHSNRAFYKSFADRLQGIPDNERYIVICLVYAHVLGYHSHVYLDSIRDMKRGVLECVNRNPHAHVVVKGPSSYSFSKRSDHVAWMPDAYALPYAQWLYDEFMDVHDRVVYVNSLDITIATEQWFIHPEDYVVNELVYQMLNFVCD